MKKNKHEDMHENGDYCFVSDTSNNTAGIAIKCPGCGSESYLSVKKDYPPPNWEWNGNEEKPTLTPSVHSVGCCGWHGWLRDGEWVKC